MKNMLLLVIAIVSVLLLSSCAANRNLNEKYVEKNRLKGYYSDGSDAIIGLDPVYNKDLPTGKGQNNTGDPRIFPGDRW